MVGALFLFLLVQGPAAAEKSRAGSDPAPGKIAKQRQTSRITPASEDQSPPASPWLQQVKEDIRKSEYHVTWQEKTYLLDIPAAWQAPNRAGDLRTYFTPEGFHMIPRQSAAPEWKWGLAFKAYGFEGDLAEASPASLSTTENRIEYRRDGRLKNLLEWYLNDERGLEQGFTLSTPPSRSSSNSTVVVLRMEIQGNLRANSDASGQAIEFLTPGGVQVMRYGGLQARDAKGQELPAHLSLTGKIIHILVETAGAVYPITIDPLATSAAWTAESDQAGARFSVSVGTAGNVNGDGYADVIIGAFNYDNGQTDEGRAFVYHGSASGLSATPNWTAESDQAGARFGVRLGTAGDVNGDGYSDVIVGADLYDNGQTNEGRAFVYHGSASGLSATPNWTAESDRDDGYFGYVGTAGDVNGDGYSDVIVAAPYYTNGQSQEGRVYVYHGSASGLSQTAAWTAESDQAGSDFGFAVGTAGDVNGDGYADVIIGAYQYDNGQTDEGRVFVYHGSASGLSATPNWTAESNQGSAQFGVSVGTAGDVNGDGYSDVIIAAPFYDNGQTDEGRAFVYHGSASGLSATPNWTAESDQASAYFGRAVGTAGDVNGDGYSDVIVGADYYDNGQTDEGRAFVYYGNAGTGLNLIPQQRRYNNNAPIGPLGRSDKADSFRVAALGRTPYGRGKVKLEWEVKPLGTAFNGSNTQKSSSWTQIGTTGSQLNEIVSSLNASTSYHWRVRLLYHPATTPFQQHSRWLTPAWNGPQEADFRTSSLATLVELVSFQLTASAGFSLLEWQTAAETDSAGFHLWRRDNQSGEFRRITGALIPATGSPSSGATYTFEDRNLVQGRTYTYLLEEVDTAGTSTLYQQDTGIDPPLQGDVNSDGKLDLTDVLYILQVLSGARH